MKPGRALILDANILIRLVLGSRVREVLLEHSQQATFLTPEVCFEDAYRYLPDLLQKRSIDPAPAIEVLNHFQWLVRPLEESTYLPAREDALARIGARDANDWPILAAALTLGCPIWTEDRDFFGTGVATWTTDRVEIYLKNA